MATAYQELLPPSDTPIRRRSPPTKDASLSLTPILRWSNIPTYRCASVQRGIPFPFSTQNPPSSVHVRHVKFFLLKNTFRSRGRINLSISVASKEKRTWVTEPRWMSHWRLKCNEMYVVFFFFLNWCHTRGHNLWDPCNFPLPPACQRWGRMCPEYQQNTCAAVLHVSLITKRSLLCNYVAVQPRIVCCVIIRSYSGTETSSFRDSYFYF